MIQKLKINEGEQKIPQTEKGTASEQRRRKKGSLDEREKRRIEKGSMGTHKHQKFRIGGF
jgi:hypothetical protein